MKPKTVARLACAGIAGALQTVAFVHTQAWPLPLLAVAWLAWQVDRATPRQAAALGWSFGCAWGCASTWWLFISLHRYGQLPAAFAVVSVLLLSGLLALYLSFAMAWVARRRSGVGLRDAARFAAAWLAAELARGVFFTGFPWAATGYSQVDGPLAVLAPWIGVYGIGAWVAWVAACLGLGAARTQMGAGWRRSVTAPVGLALTLLALPAAWSLWRGAPEFTLPGRTLQVALLQTNVAQDEKFAAQYLPEALAWVSSALTGARADLVLAPETAVPLLPDQLAELVPGYWAGLQQHFAQPGRAALVGVPLGSLLQGYTNSVVGLSASGSDYRYDKVHLVPFGEFIPTGFRWFTELLSMPLGDFNRGPLNPPSFERLGERIGLNICYEDLFGEELALRFADASSAPSILANVSNIGWFGDTIAVAQHLHISRLRSLELQRPMLRATNTGATAVIDHRGVVTARLAPFTRGVLHATVQGRRGLTPFARWSAAAGLWPLWLLAGLGLAWPRGRLAPLSGR